MNLIYVDDTELTASRGELHTVAQVTNIIYTSVRSTVDF